MKQMSYRQGLDLNEEDVFENFQEAIITEELKHHRQRTHMRKTYKTEKSQQRSKH